MESMQIRAEEVVEISISGYAAQLGSIFIYLFKQSRLCCCCCFSGLPKDDWFSMLPVSVLMFFRHHVVSVSPLFCCRKKWIRSRSSYQTFFHRRQRFFPFFATKLGHFVVHTPFVICYKHSSLTLRIGKPKKWKFGRIDSCFKICL